MAQFVAWLKLVGYFICFTRSTKKLRVWQLETRYWELENHSRSNLGRVSWLEEYYVVQKKTLIHVTHTLTLPLFLEFNFRRNSATTAGYLWYVAVNLHSKGK